MEVAVVKLSKDRERYEEIVAVTTSFSSACAIARLYFDVVTGSDVSTYPLADALNMGLPYAT